jgi:glutamate synthase domain-containing protein 2
MEEVTVGWVAVILHWMSMGFILLVGFFVAVVIAVFIKDRLQTEHAIRHNYPVIARFRYLFEYLGKFMRQYMYAADQDGRPFNRAQRSWVYRAAKNLSTTQSFGSTRNLSHPGKVLFINCAFPMLEKDGVTSPPMMIGPNTKTPFRAQSIFNISGMSFGALSKPAVLALSQGAKKAGCWMNTGEGGISPFHLQGGGDLVAQIGTAKYGYRDKNGNLSNEKLREAAAHEQVRMFEIKMSQGAKPGKGGILPGAKVTQEIADIRGIPVGEDSISPNRHPEIHDNESLLDMIHQVREVTCKPVGFKFVMGSPQWFESFCQTIQQRGLESAPDFITIDGAEGGTGSAPVALMDDVGMPLAEALPCVIDLLTKYQLREQVRVIASGKLMNPTMVAWALAMGADFINSARGFMFSLGCIQAMQCHQDTCPTGITTHNKRLQSGLVPEKKSARVASYHQNLMHEVSSIAHSCGVGEARELSRQHARVVQGSGQSITLSEIYPDEIPLSFNGIDIETRIADKKPSEI